MQSYEQDSFDIYFSRFTRYDTVSTYDSTMLSFIIYYSHTSAFCMHVVHDISYDILIVSSHRILNSSSVHML